MNVFLLTKIKTKLKEAAEDECLLTIIGNKVDLCENDESRVVKYKDGAYLADVCFRCFS